MNSISDSERLLRRRGFLGGLAALACTGGLVTGAEPDLDLGGRRLFPDSNPWNQDISKLAVDPNSDALIKSIGLEKRLHPDFGTPYEGFPLGIPYAVVSGKQRKVPVKFEYPGESDPGPYPIPDVPPVEGNGKGDRHILIIDRDNWKLYELFAAERVGRGWHAGSGAIFDLNSNALRPLGWTSADAAGLPVLPGLVRYDEAVEQKAIRHALRFTCRMSRAAYVSPARHYASRKTDPTLPPMGMRVRLKSSFDVEKFPPVARAVLTALKQYGMFLADNGGDWFVSGVPDTRWNDEDIQTMKRIKGHDLEVVRMSRIITR